MLNEKEFREAEAPLKALEQKIADLWTEHERLQAALYAKSEWTAKQIASHKYKYEYERPKGALAEINRMIEFHRFIQRYGQEFPKLRFWEFERLLRSYQDNFQKIVDYLRDRRVDKACNPADSATTVDSVSGVTEVQADSE